MQVETYEQIEVTSEPTAAPDAEAIALIEQLGLNGQRSLIAPQEPGSKAAVIPYARVTAEESDTYAVLFPTAVYAEDYDAGPIPVRVMQVIAHARELGLRCVIWYPSDAVRRDDPILVGYQKDSPHGARYLDRPKALLLARWGTALRPFPDLKREAAAIARESLLAKLSKTKREMEADLAALASASDSAVLRSANRHLHYAGAALDEQPPF